MIPCLYKETETAFTTNGIGKLCDALSCLVTEKRNGAYELKMEYPSFGIHGPAGEAFHSNRTAHRGG
jgi:phage-related protein